MREGGDGAYSGFDMAHMNAGTSELHGHGDNQAWVSTPASAHHRVEKKHHRHRKRQVKQELK